MSYQGDRDLLPRYWERKTPADVLRYRAEKNATSVDGLPAMPVTEPRGADIAGCSRCDRLRG